MKCHASKMCPRALILTIVALVIFAHSIQISHVQAWGLTTHQFIASNAIGVFSDNSFFSAYSTVITDWSIVPDTVFKAADPIERYRHWYHIDEPEGENEYYRGGLPDNWVMLNKGVLPWAVEDNFNTFVQLLTEEDWEGAAQLAGAMSHYVEDASNPLHATSDYTPGGNHGAYEGEVNYQVSVDNVTILEHVPHEVDNVFDLMKQLLAESYGFTGYTENDLNYWLSMDVLWNDTIKDITENRLRTDVQILANIWYTGMIQANLVIAAPTLSLPGNGANIIDNTPTFEWSSTVAGYQLEYATDNTFTTNVTIVKDLTTTSYTPATPLAGSTWYWRVRSGDNTTSVGLWSDTWQFTVGTWTGTAVLSLVDLYTVNVEKNLDLYRGPKLVVKFYDYSDAYENENVIENFSPPYHVEENEIARHPEGTSVKKAMLVLAEDNTENVISTITTFTVTRSVLNDRLVGIYLEWPFASPERRNVLMNEITDVYLQWPYAPF